VLDLQLCQGAVNLGRVQPVHLAARRERQEVVTASVGVRAGERPVSRDHLVQPQKARRCAFLLGGIVQRDDQVERRLTGEPRVGRTVLKQHHSGSGRRGRFLRCGERLGATRTKPWLCSAALAHV